MRLFLAALVLSFATVAAASAQTTEEVTAPPQARECFSSNSWRGWSAPGEGDAIYLRVQMNDIYRVDLTPGSHVRRRSSQFLINTVRGSGWICSPLDLELALSDHMGFRQPLIATGLRKLTAEEIAAIPADDLPD